MIEVREKDGGVSFPVRVQPRASRNDIGGEWQGALRVRLAAPPVDDRANEALRRLLAERLNVPLAAVKIARGQHGRSKRVEIRGVTAAQVLSLAAPQAGLNSLWKNSKSCHPERSEGSAFAENKADSSPRQKPPSFGMTGF